MSNRMRKVVKWGIGVILVFLLIVFLALEGLYYYGLRVLPDNTMPETVDYPRGLLNVQWVVTEFENEIKLTPITPIGYLITFIKAVNQSSSSSDIKVFPAGLSLASQNARFLLSKEQNDDVRKNWHLNNISATIWVTNNWTAKQAISNLLTVSYYGNGFFGIEAAARGYFNKDYQNLDIYEASLLIGLQKAPSYFNPWCEPERALNRMNYVVEKLTSTWPSTYMNTLPQESLPQGLVNGGNKCKT